MTFPSQFQMGPPLQSPIDPHPFTTTTTTDLPTGPSVLQTVSLSRSAASRLCRRLPYPPIFTSLRIRLCSPSHSSSLFFHILPPPPPRTIRMLHDRLLMLALMQQPHSSHQTRIKLHISGFTCLKCEMNGCHYVAFRDVVHVCMCTEQNRKRQHAAGE